MARIYMKFYDILSSTDRSNNGNKVNQYVTKSCNERDVFEDERIEK